jgi:hypothetical protein
LVAFWIFSVPLSSTGFADASIKNALNRSGNVKNFNVFMGL